MNLVLQTGMAWYAGKRHNVVVLIIDGNSVQLSNADASLCCSSMDHCNTVLKAYAAQFGADKVGVRQQVIDLMAHCRKTTGWKDGCLTRDKPKVRYRRFTWE